MQYLAYFQYANQHPNLLSKAIAEYLRGDENRKLIAAADIESYKRSVMQNIEAINRDFPRCRPIVARWDKRYGASDYFEKADLRLAFTGVKPCCFSLYSSR